MSTISFNCPKCGRLCAFQENCAGRVARCTRCQQRFTIPSESNAKAEIVRDAPNVLDESDEPIDGFYSVLFVRTWRIFTRPDSTAGIVFLIAIVCFRFFLSHADYAIKLPGFVLNIPIGWITIITTWGCQLWYYMEMVEATWMDFDELPEVAPGSGFDFIWTIIKSIYLFVCSLMVTILPFAIAAAVLRNLGVTSPWILTPLPLLGMVGFPMVLLILCTGQEMYNVFRPDYIVLPIVRATKPYIVVVLTVIVAAAVEFASRNLGDLKDPAWYQAVLHLAGNIAAAFLGIVAMRATGLFGRHYKCYLPWY